MKTIDLAATVRTDAGRKFAARLRKQEQVPAVIYGGEKNLMVTLGSRDLTKAICSPNVYLFNISVEGKTHRTVVKDVQFHPVTDSIIHVDFYEVNDSRSLTVALPVLLTGQAEGTKQGGKLVQITRKVKVHGLVNDLPEAIELDVTPLTIGKSIVVGDLKFDKFHIEENKSMLLVAVKATRKAVADDQAEAEAETPAAAK